MRPRTLTIPPPPNPSVEEQRAGYAIRSADATRFITGDMGAASGPVLFWGGYRFGWCAPSGPVKVWNSLTTATAAATSLGGTVTTVPRCNGYCRVWEDVAGDQGWDDTTLTWGVQ